jgi:hypothetical protein
VLPGEPVIDDVAATLQVQAGHRVDRLLLGGLVYGQQSNQPLEGVVTDVPAGRLDVEEQVADLVVLLDQQIHHALLRRGSTDRGPVGRRCAGRLPSARFLAEVGHLGADVLELLASQAFADFGEQPTDRLVVFPEQDDGIRRHRYSFRSRQLSWTTQALHHQTGASRVPSALDGRPLT